MITVEHLRKEFTYYRKMTGIRGSLHNVFHRETLTKEAVRDISFSVGKGEMIGFLGPNGAGKTTTLKMLSGILYPTGGADRSGRLRPLGAEKRVQAPDFHCHGTEEPALVGFARQ